MAHYAFLDSNSVVTEVIVGVDENELIEGQSPEQWYGNFRQQKCIRTSYNNNIRKRYAGIGYRYDEIRDAFIPPQPFLSWLFDEENLNWKAPIPYPNDEKVYSWNETALSWVLEEQ
jgi:hypothetical protein